VIDTDAERSGPRAPRRPQRWVAAATALVAAVTLTVGVTTPPRSGPWCTSGCVVYPYTDVAQYVPRDYLWMYPAVALAVLFVVLIAGLDEGTSRRLRVFSRTSLALATASATLLVADYAVQLTVLQPSLLRGETEGLSPLSQYNPHGVFIALENLGYLLAGLAFLCAAAGSAGADRLRRAVRWIFLGGGALIVAALAVLAVAYRADLEYRFEVTGLAIAWIVLIVNGTLLSLAPDVDPP